ncbi:MAG TPA: aminotransferase class I/II-fold pyridoxal phosphate-dependent enzyme [Hyphomicrobiaceae bacterium]|nr:aminotransferase class I/II-fold pyridoxal phosphate-dependent enzyme [Hyphomicrobiaceae bacterium]
MTGVSWNKRISAVVERLGPRKTAAGGATVLYPKPSFSDLPAAKSIQKYEGVGRMLGIKTPFFRCIEGASGSTTTIEGRSYLNFAWCDYLGLNRSPQLWEAAKAAIDRYGTCVSASRMVAGETPLHRELEAEIADFLGVEDAILFVSGHAANVSTIGTIMSEDDLIVHDEFVHNSAVIGIRLSRAAARSFRHNDFDELEAILREHRSSYRNVLVVVEGLYSTEGDLPDLKRVIEIKERYGAWLMVDDAHGLGVLGKTGRGIAEHCGVDPRKVDIWMGTLSKTLASCGGYIAGERPLIDLLKHTAPGFVFSVGLLPMMTAAALAGLRLIRAEPERVARLHANGALFLQAARAAGLDTGNSRGYGMLPVIAGNVIRSIQLWHRVFGRGLNPSLIVYPGVPMKAGRLRFFLTSEHTSEEIERAIAVTREELAQC